MKIIVITLSLFLSIKIYAQNPSQTSYWGLLPLLQNPVSFQDQEEILVQASFRSQWMSLEQSAVNQRLFLSIPTVVRNLNFGLGFQNENIGVQSYTKFKGGLSRTFSTDAGIDFGLSGTVNYIQYSIRANDLNPVQQGDVLLSSQAQSNKLSYDLGLKAKYSDFSLGLAINSINQPIFTEGANNLLQELLWYNIILGYDKDISNNLDLVSFISLLSNTRVSQTSFEVGLTYRKKVFASVGMRGVGEKNTDAAILRGGFHSDIGKFYLTYEPGLSTLNEFHSNTLDLGVELKLANFLTKINKSAVYENPRY